ncbi:MAG: hypothetical protein U9Q23_01560 [Candidatus Bipolaricaulota bacterium]|nr:hypothetical protein [Candidatus Bipolaricaulota bacterium]
MRFYASIVVILLLFAVCSLAQDPSFNAEIEGQKTWSLSYGIGDKQGLARLGVPANQLLLDQTLAVEVSGEAFSILTLTAHFNDQEPVTMQSLTVKLDTDDLDGVFGDFSISGRETFAVYNKKLKGARLDYYAGEIQLTGILSLIEGISESQTFVGNKGHAEVVFSSHPSGQPWIEQTYLLNLKGLYHYLLTEPFIADYSILSLDFQPGNELEGLLTGYGLGYISDRILAAPSEELTKGIYTTVSSAGEFLILKREPVSLLRTRVRGYIDAYNEEEGLSGDEKREYPFNKGTEYELLFLDRLAAFCSLVVDGQTYPLTDGKRQRFYWLGRDEILEESLQVEVSIDGEVYRPITDPSLTSYSVGLFPKQGIMELDFPATFFAGEENAVKATFDYTTSGDTFMLGPSIVSGSERVYLNGELLRHDVDYSIDYEVGLVIMFVEVGPEDRIRIDYERPRGGLGGGAEYNRYFYGAILQIPLSAALQLDLSLLQVADSEAPVVDREKARTMPNRHTVSGIDGSIQLDDFTASFSVGYSYDLFPFDDNLRISLPNKVTSILSVSDYTFIGHLNGLSVYRDKNWGNYDSSDGLAGNRVYDMAAIEEYVFFATGSGLTSLHLIGEFPLAQVANWRRYYKDDGLPGAPVRALATGGMVLWVGTDAGLARVMVDEIDTAAAWTHYTTADFPELADITSLAVADDLVYIGTGSGLYRLGPDSKTLSAMPGPAGINVNDILIEGETLYMACQLGLRSFHSGVGTGWVTFGEPVYSLAMRDGELWYGTGHGLYRVSPEETLFPADSITALAVAPTGAIWAGSAADSDYRLSIWEIGADIQQFDNSQTGIDGQDHGRFADIPADQHTDKGLLLSADFHRELEGFTLTGRFESVSPQFTPIGGTSRSDSTGWTLAGSLQPAGEISIDAEHNYYLLDQATDPTSTMNNSISLKWSPGPTLAVSVQQAAVDDEYSHPGFDNGRLSYSIGLNDSRLDGALEFSVDWDDTFYWGIDTGDPYRENRLGFSTGWQPLQGLSFSADWERPLMFSSGSKRERLGFAVDWSQAITGADLGISYVLSAARPLPQGNFVVVHVGGVELRIDRFSLLEISFIPSAELTLAYEEGILSFVGKANLRGELDVLAARVSYRGEGSGVGKEDRRRKDRLNLSLTYGGIPDLQPSLAYRLSKTAVFHGQDARVSVDHSLTGRLSWVPATPYSDNLSLSMQWSTNQDKTSTAISLQNNFSYRFSESISMRLELDGSYTDTPTPDLGLDLSGAADISLSKMWRMSLAATLANGIKSAEPYHSLLLELFVAATF